MAITCAIVDLINQDNQTIQDALQFGTPGDTTWSLTGMSFKMEVKASRDDVAPLVTWTSGAGQIIVDDPVQRVVHLNIPDTVIQASLPPADYVYDFIMLDGSTPAIRTPLMQGLFSIRRGVTED
jgi:hypothetical protein